MRSFSSTIAVFISMLWLCNSSSSPVFSRALIITIIRPPSAMYSFNRPASPAENAVRGATTIAIETSFGTSPVERFTSCTSNPTSESLDFNSPRPGLRASSSTRDGSPCPVIMAILNFLFCLSRITAVVSVYSPRKLVMSAS